MEDYWPVIVLTFVGFISLAALLLVPVWKFLGKEEEAADRFNKFVDGNSVVQPEESGHSEAFSSESTATTEESG